MNRILNQNVLIEKAHHKAILNVFIVPLILTVTTMNILFVAVYWGFIYVLYRFVFQTKQLNKLYFFKYLKTAAATLFFIGVFAFILIVL
ncbi:MAG: hypothetical protein WC141_05160 [Arcobacteraceae bacterium]